MHIYYDPFISNDYALLVISFIMSINISMILTGNILELLHNVFGKYNITPILTDTMIEMTTESLYL